MNLITFYFDKVVGQKLHGIMKQKKACSELLVFLDSDDLLLADSLSQRINYFESNPNYENAYSNYKVSFKTKNDNDHIIEGTHSNVISMIREKDDIAGETLNYSGYEKIIIFPIINNPSSSGNIL